MKAHKVEAPIPELPSQPCCECGKMLKAPWGHVDGGKKWVCSKYCNDLFYHEIPHVAATIRKLLAT